jgi:hypothetical protein
MSKSKEMALTINPLLEEGEEATTYNSVSQEILKEEAKKLTGISKQADNWNALANQVVGAKFV